MQPVPTTRNTTLKDHKADLQPKANSLPGAEVIRKSFPPTRRPLSTHDITLRRPDEEPLVTTTPPQKKVRSVSATTDTKQKRVSERGREIKPREVSLRKRTTTLFHKDIVSKSWKKDKILIKELVGKGPLTFENAQKALSSDSIVNYELYREAIEELIIERFNEQKGQSLSAVVTAIQVELFPGCGEMYEEIIESTIYREMEKIRTDKKRRESFEPLIKDINTRNIAYHLERGSRLKAPWRQEVVPLLIKALAYFDTDDASRAKATNAFARIYRSATQEQQGWFDTELENSQLPFKEQIKLTVKSSDKIKAGIKEQLEGKKTLDIKRASGVLVQEDYLIDVAVQGMIEHLVEREMAKAPLLHNLVSKITLVLQEEGFDYSSVPNATDIANTIARTAQDKIQENTDVKNAKQLLKQVEESVQLAKRLDSGENMDTRQEGWTDQLLSASLFIYPTQRAMQVIGELYLRLSEANQIALQQKAQVLAGRTKSTLPPALFASTYYELSAIDAAKGTQFGYEDAYNKAQHLLTGLKYEKDPVAAYKTFSEKAKGEEEVFTRALQEQNCNQQPLRTMLYLDAINRNYQPDVMINNVPVNPVERLILEAPTTSALKDRLSVVDDAYKDSVIAKIRSPALRTQMQADFSRSNTVFHIINALEQGQQTQFDTFFTPRLLQELVNAITKSDDPGGLLTALLCMEQIMNDKEAADAIRSQVLQAKGERKKKLQERLNSAEKCVDTLSKNPQTKLQLRGGSLQNVKREAKTPVSRVGHSKESQQAIRHLFETIKEYSAVCDTLEERNCAKGLLCAFVRSAWGSAALKNNPEIQSTQRELLLALDRTKSIPNVPKWMPEDQLIKMYIANSDPAIRLNVLLTYRWFFDTKKLFTKLNANWDSFSREEKQAINDFCQEWLNDEAIHARDYVNPEIFSQLTLLADKIEAEPNLARTTLKEQIEDIQGDKKFVAEQKTRSEFSRMAKKFTVNDQDIATCTEWVTDQFYPASNDTKKEVMETIIKIRSRAKELGIEVDELDSAIGKIVYKENKPPSSINLEMGTEKLTDALGAIFSGKTTGKAYESLVDNIAKDLRLLDSYVSSNLQIDEFCNLSYQKKLDFDDSHIKIKGTHTSDFTEVFNRVPILVSQIVIQNITPQNRGKIAKFIVDLSEKLHEIGDINLLATVNTVFGKTAVHRLNLVNNLDPDYQEKSGRLSALTSEDKSFKRLREEEQNLSVNAIHFLPFLGAKLTDLTMTDQGNKSKSEGNLNTDKLQLLSNKNCEILRMIESATSIREGNSTLHFDLTELLYGKLPTDDELYELSLKKQRREAKDNTLIAEFDQLLERTPEEKRTAIRKIVTGVGADTIIKVFESKDVSSAEKTALVKALCQKRVANDQRQKFEAVFAELTREDQVNILQEVESRDHKHKGKYGSRFIDELRGKVKPETAEEIPAPSPPPELSEKAEIPAPPPPPESSNEAINKELEEGLMAELDSARESLEG